LEDYEKVKSENIKLQEKLNQMELLLKNWKSIKNLYRKKYKI
jgi:hypothetical protein